MKKLIIFEIFNLFCVLGVLSDKGMAVENEPIFGSTKSRDKSVIGDDEVFYCRIKNLGNHSVSWMKGNEIIAAGNDSVEPRRIMANYYPEDGWYPLQILDLRWEDAGNYTCQINTNPPRQDLFTLELIDPKFVTTNQTFRVTRGETFVLPCEIKDIDDWIPYWKKIEVGSLIAYQYVIKESREGTSVLGPHRNKFKFVDGFNLEIKNVSDEDAGTWICGFEKTDRQIRHRLKVVDRS